MGWGLVLNLANSILLLNSLFSLPFISHFQNVQRQSQLHVVISISYMQILKKCLLRNKSGDRKAWSTESQFRKSKKSNKVLMCDL